MLLLMYPSLHAQAVGRAQANVAALKVEERQLALEERRAVLDRDKAAAKI